MRRKEIVVSSRAECRLDTTIEYLEKKWGIAAKKKFLKKLYSALRLISKMPELFPVSSQSPQLRKCVITKQTIMFYRIGDDFIEIVTFHDARQEFRDPFENI